MLLTLMAGKRVPPADRRGSPAVDNNRELDKRSRKSAPALIAIAEMRVLS
jgi:hypothetical protein